MRAQVPQPRIPHMPRIGLATLACAVLSGADPSELQQEEDKEELVLSSNSTDDESTVLPPATWAAIISGVVAAVLLVAGLIVVLTRPRASTVSDVVDVGVSSANGNRFFVGAGARVESVNRPLLRMPTDSLVAAHGKCKRERK